MDPQRVPPQNLEAEQSVLGGILIDNQTFHKVIEQLTPDQFYRPANAKIFRAMCELSSKAEPIDVVTLTAKMKELDVFEESGGAAYLADLLERVPTAIHAEYHAKLVAEQSIKRNLVSACTDIGSRGMDPAETSEELLDYAERTIFSLASDRKTRTVAPIRDIVRSAFVELEKRYDNQDSLTGIPTGFIDLDKLTTGLQPSDLIIVACRPSMGKTSFALGVTRHAAVHAKAPIIFFSLEMAKEQLVTRLLAAEAKVDSQRIRTGRLTEGDWAKLTRAAGMISEAPIYIDDTPALTVLEMRGRARRLKAELGSLGVVIVDYLQIMGTARHAESREKAISDISRSLKALAKELQVPVIALSQLNRNIDLRQDKRPMMADLRESGAIEQDADIIVFIHREATENQQPNTPSIAEFIVGKHRNGPCGTVKVVWLGQFATFENMASSAPPT